MTKRDKKDASFYQYNRILMIIHHNIIFNINIHNFSKKIIKPKDT